MGEWEAWLKAGTGDDKTDIVVIADFWQRTGGLFSRDRDISSNAFQIPWGGSMVASWRNLAAFECSACSRKCFSAPEVFRSSA